ncbi:MAG: HAAS signaling domain-containing protein [Bacillota bacterium]
MNNHLIEAYIEEVTRRLPENKRKDIKEELVTLIEDQLEEENTSIKAVLESLGDPKILADKYLDRTAYLIGPNYYYAYIATLKLVIPIVLLAISIAMLVGIIFNGELNISTVFEFIGSLFMGALQAFTWITIGFAIASKTSSKHFEKEKWTIKDLNVQKVKRKKFSKVEGLIAIFFILVVLVIFNLYPDVIAIHSLTEQRDSVLLFDLNKFNDYLIWFNIAFIFSIAHNFLKLIFENYKPLYAYIAIPLKILSTAIFITIILQPELLNPNFTQELIAFGFSSEYDWLNMIGTVILVIAILSILGLVVDIIKDIYYSFKFDKDFIIRLKRKK